MRCTTCRGFLYLDGIDIHGNSIYTCDGVITHYTKAGVLDTHRCGAGYDLTNRQRIFIATFPISGKSNTAHYSLESLVVS